MCMLETNKCLLMFARFDFVFFYSFELVFVLSDRLETTAEVLQVATSMPTCKEKTDLVIEEDQIASCVTKVLHR